ncbi:MAG: hypothetical protein JWN37_116 [Candidatus Nomurabacteria bacterium]|nr:hypothetical protein [Candidatus Nomurabacteria bacterium]
MNKIGKIAGGVIALLIIGGIAYSFFLRPKVSDVAAVNTATSTPLLVCEDMVNSEEKYDFPFLCTQPLSQNGDRIEIFIDEKGDADIMSGTSSVIHLLNFTTAPDNAKNTIYSELFGVSGFSPFSFNDINFDGILDLEVLSSSGAYNMRMDYYVYNPKTKAFVLALPGIINPSFDKDARTITSFDKWRGLGDLYSSEVYHYENGEYVLAKEITQDFDPSDRNNEQPGYLYTEKERIRGKMATTTIKHLTYKEVTGQDPSAN